MTYFYEDLPGCDVIVEPGVSAWSDADGKIHSARIIAAMANSEKGIAFLTAYFAPEELDSLKRQANLAGIALVRTGQAGQ